MMKWKARAPDIFPAAWHQLLREEPGLRPFVIADSVLEHTIRLQQRRWQVFLLSCRTHGGQYQLLAERYNFRTRVRFNPSLDRWELLLSISEKLENLLDID
jgi:hypothetical protein